MTPLSYKSVFYFTILIISSFFMNSPVEGQEKIPAINADIKAIPGFPSAVHGLCLDETGVLYFSDTYSKVDEVSKIYTLTAPYTDSAVATDITGQSLSGLIWLEDRLYVSYLNKNEIHVFNSELEEEEIWYIDAPWNLTSSGKYVFVITYGGEIGVFTRGKIRTIIEDLEFPFDIEDTGDNSFWISEQVGEDKPGRVRLLNYKGEVLQEVNFSFDDPKGLAQDEAGNLYVADAGANKIYQVSPSGKVRLVTDEYEEPLCIAIRQDGALLVNTNHDGGTLLIIRIRK